MADGQTTVAPQRSAPLGAHEAVADVHVRLSHVTKRFEGTAAAAVDDISLAVPRGSFTTFLGPSGCGKTTTLRMVAGFYTPDSGDIFMGDRRINDVPVHRRKAAMVFQDYALFPHMSVAQNVGYGLRLAKVPREQAHKRVQETLRFLGLAGLEERAPSQLSGGQQQRVALARALVMNPEVLLLDEPLSNLDAKLRESIRGELTAIQRQLQITTIYVTHDQDEALAMSDWVAVMNRGRVVQWGTPWDVYYRPRTPFMADFVGSVNLVRAHVLATGAGAVRVRLPGSEEALGLPFEGDRLPPVHGEALLCIRPETLALAPPGGRAQQGCVALAGQVVRRTFLGNTVRYAVRAADAEWLIDQPDPGATDLLDGSVSLLVNPRRIHVVPEADAP